MGVLGHGAAQAPDRSSARCSVRSSTALRDRPAMHQSHLPQLGADRRTTASDMKCPGLWGHHKVFGLTGAHQQEDCTARSNT